MSEVHVSDLIPAYILSCLLPAEKHRVEKHLQTCAECKQELKSYEPVITGLAVVPVQIDPTPGLKKTIMQAVISGDDEQPVVQTSFSRHFEKRSKLSRLGPWLRVWSVASLVLVIVLAITSLILFNQVRDLSQKNAGISSQFTVIPLNGTSTAPEASGVMIISNHGLSGSLNVDGLPPLDTGHQYQLWLLEEGKRINGGVFSVTPQGSGTLRVNSSLPLFEYKRIGITIEPAGGSSGPTGDQVLGGGA